MSHTLPMLGSEGFTKDPEVIMSRLLQHAFLTDQSQSNIYQGAVTSLQYLISEHAQDSLGLSIAVRNALNTYYSRYMDDVTVNFVQTDFFDPEDAAKMNFDLSITGYVDNVRYDLSRTLQVDSSQGTANFFNALDR